MGKTLYLSLFLLVLGTNACYAQKKDLQEAQHAVSLFVSHKFSADPGEIALADVPDSLNFFAFNVGVGNGYVLVSKNTGNAILGYAARGRFDWKSLPSNAQSWMLGYQHAVHSNEIQKLQNGKSLKALKNTVDPLCEANWWQNGLYKVNCPVSQEGDTAVVGCVATAMGIIMKKWNYPLRGSGSISYVDKKYGAIVGSFEESVYNWQAMPVSLTSESSLEQVDAVATLLADCAMALKSAFGNEKSGTEARIIVKKNYPTENAEFAFPAYFGYDKNTIKGVIRSAYSTKKWKELIKKELSEGRPLIYSGTSSGSTVGHCFVCDGYDADGFFHFNWGWNGDLNGYFSIDSIVPYKGYDFSYNQEALIGITPPASFLDSIQTSVSHDYVLPNVQVYPNPAHEQLNVCLSADNTACNFYLINCEGAVVKNIRPGVNNVFGLPKGIYVLTGFVNGDRFTKKVELR